MTAKTIKDLEELRNKESEDLGIHSSYEAYIEYLCDCYIAKSYGVDRVKAELSRWDKECRDVLLNSMIATFESYELNFNTNKFLEDMVE